MKYIKNIPIIAVLLFSGFCFADDDDGPAVPSQAQITQQNKQNQDNINRINSIKKCSSYVPANGQIDQQSLVNIKQCLADNNAYMPKEYQFTPDETHPVQQTMQTYQPQPSQNIQQQPEIQQQQQQQQPQQQQQTSSSSQGDSQQSDDLGPSYLR